MLKNGNVYILGGKEYIILATIRYKKINYALANLVTDKLDNELEEYTIFYQDNNSFKVVSDIKLLNELIPIFRKNVKELREEYLK